MTGLTQLLVVNNLRVIEELPAWLPRSLQWLDASGCKVGEVPAVAESLHNLARLRLNRQDAEVRVLRPLVPLVSGCANLKQLTIGGSR
jgi:hypothetical protein